MVILNTLQRYKIKTPFVKFYVIQKVIHAENRQDLISINHDSATSEEILPY